jgi:hypothetical protein
MHGTTVEKKFVVFSDFVNVRDVHSLSGSEISEYVMFEGINLHLLTNLNAVLILRVPYIVWKSIYTQQMHHISFMSRHSLGAILRESSLQLK